MKGLKHNFELPSQGVRAIMCVQGQGRRLSHDKMRRKTVQGKVVSPQVRQDKSKKSSKEQMDVQWVSDWS